MKNVIRYLFILFLCGMNASDCLAAEDISILVPGHEAKLTYQIMDENKLLVSVLNLNGDPIRGLKAENFIAGRGIQKARILSADPLETVEEIALNIVLVVDNSFSMKERRAIKPLLAAIDEFFKTVRAIDNIHVVVFGDHPAMKANNYELHTKTFNSSNVSELRNFLAESFEHGLTGKTYLYEAMMAAINIIRNMPDKDNKFLVVFSDGEDLNSGLSASVIETETEGIKNFEAFCVDYMPGSKLNRFLTSFAETHNGRIWKATSASELLPIFQSFTTTLRHRYVVSYQVLDPVGFEQSHLNFDMLTMIDGSPVANYLFFETGKSEIPVDYVIFKDRSQAVSFDVNTLTTSLDRYLNILNLVGQHLSRNVTSRIKIVGCNSDTGIEKDNLDLSQRRAEAVKNYLLEVWGIDASRIDAEARNLPAKATPMDLVGARPENQRAEILYEVSDRPADAIDDFIVETNSINELTVKTNIFSAVGFADWQLTLSGDNQPLKNLAGKDNIQALYRFSLDDLGLQNLVILNSLGVRAIVTNVEGDTYDTAAALLPITVSRKVWVDELVRPPQGSVTLEPPTVTIEELTTIDSSPFLNYIYFESSEGELPDRYKLFNNQSDTKTFDEGNLKSTLEKHHHILNIIGQRLVKNPQARIRIVGCNSNKDAEQGKTELSRSRAEAVRAYLRYIWGIDSSRMEVEARNLPQAASTSSLVEGRAENQRVEIYSDSPTLLDIIKSTYVQEISDSKELRIQPQIQSGYGISSWTIQLTGDGAPIESLQGTGDLEPAYRLVLADIDFHKISSCKTITAAVEVKDQKGQTCRATADAAVTFIKRQERLARKMGYKVLEKYALILFDFNRSDIKAHNQEIVDRIVSRIKEIPTANVRVVGHTDTIGNEEYNLVLSIKRAKAAYDEILAGGVAEGENISYEGIGPNDPLFDNELPEGRALNRTVTVYLEYEENK